MDSWVLSDPVWGPRAGIMVVETESHTHTHTHTHTLTLTLTRFPADKLQPGGERVNEEQWGG